jgi:1,2-diacylglycerol 3-alpha-glucosyltransferase
MRIAVISTYPPIECGIAPYTQFLTDELKKTSNEIIIISQHGAKGDSVFPVYNADDPDPAKEIFDITMKLTPDIVHIQHEYGLYGELDGIAVLDLIHRFKSSDIPTIATFHSVFEKTEFRRAYILKAMCRDLDGVIVHEDCHINCLITKYGCDPKKISLIPHGVRLAEPITDAKKRLDLTGRKVILLFGYFRETKKFDKLLEIFPQILERVPDAYLVIAGKPRKNEFNDYKNYIYDMVVNLPDKVKQNVEIFRGQFPQHTFDTIINAADITVFPYSLGAQSGVMAHSFAFGIPVVTSDLPSFVRIVQESGGGFCAENSKDYVDKIVKLLTDDKLRLRCSKNIKRYVNKELSWEIIAEKTLSAYSEFDIGLNCKNRYIYVPDEKK